MSPSLQACSPAGKTLLQLEIESIALSEICLLKTDHAFLERGWLVHAISHLLSAFPLAHTSRLRALTVCYWLGCRDALGQPLPVCAAANESFKQARALGLSDADMCAVYEVTQAGPKKAA